MKSEKNNRTIRLAGTSDRAVLYQLWQNCFHDPEAFADYYFDYWFKENKVLMLEEQSELKAMLHLNPYKIALDGLLLDSYYIVGVATAEDYRHRGAMTQLLREAFVLAYDMGMPFVYLMPADEAIYRPFQFAYIYAQQVEKKIISPQKEQSFVEAAGMDISFRSAAAEEDWQDAADMVNSYMERRYDLFTWRSAHYFERLQLENRADGGDLLMLYGGDEWIGYLSYAREAAVEVREIYCKPEWRRQAADWLMTYFEAAEGEILTPMTEGFLENKEQAVNFLRPIIMGRIVHLENWLKIMPVSGKTFSLVIKVEDRWIEANNGIWLWKAGNGSVELCRTELKPDIQLGIDALMQWLTGYWPLDELEDSGRISVWTDCRETLRDIPVTGKILINEIV